MPMGHHRPPEAGCPHRATEDRCRTSQTHMPSHSAGTAHARPCMLRHPGSTSKPQHEACPGPKDKRVVSSPCLSHPLAPETSGNTSPAQAQPHHHAPSAQPHVVTAADSSSCAPPPRFLSFSNVRAENRNPEASLGLHPASKTLFGYSKLRN